MNKNKLFLLPYLIQTQYQNICTKYAHKSYKTTDFKLSYDGFVKKKSLYST